MLACFLVALFIFGLGLYGHGVYVAELQRLHGWPPALISGASSLTLLLSSVFATFTSELIARLGPKRLILLGIAALFLVAPWKAFAVYLGILVLQLVVVRHAAATYGVRFVCTVLAQKAGRPPASSAASNRASRG